MPLYDYECKNGHRFEDFNSVAKRMSTECPTCGVKAKKLPSTARLDYYNMGTDPSMPTAWDKWAKMHEKEARRKSE
jgi:putative FmdB family regulatory protein